VGCQLEPLPLAARQRSERLAQAEVSEPDVGEPVEDLARGRRARLAGSKNSAASVTDIASTSLMSLAVSESPSRYFSTDASNRFPAHSSQVVATPAIITRSV
jgi:hypothetical protein